MKPETLFKVKIIAPDRDASSKDYRDFVYYIEEDANFPEKVIERATKEYQEEEYKDAPFWHKIIITPLEGKIIPKVGK
jgi:hypothetical protein